MIWQSLYSISVLKGPHTIQSVSCPSPTHLKPKKLASDLRFPPNLMRLVWLLNSRLSSRLTLFCCCSSVPSYRLTPGLCQWSHLPHFRRAAFLTSSDPGPTPPVVILVGHCHLQMKEGAPSSVVWSGSRWLFVTPVYVVTIASFFTALLCTFSLSPPLLLLWYLGTPRLGHVARYLCTIFSTSNLTAQKTGSQASIEVSRLPEPQADAPRGSLCTGPSSWTSVG